MYCVRYISIAFTIPGTWVNEVTSLLVVPNPNAPYTFDPLHHTVWSVLLNSHTESVPNAINDVELSKTSPSTGAVFGVIEPLFIVRLVLSPQHFIEPPVN